MDRRTEKAPGKFKIYDWDHRNRLLGLTFHDANGTMTGILHYRYDVFDRLADLDGVTGIEDVEHYIHDSAPGKGGLDDIVLPFNENDEVLHRYLHGPAIDQIFSDESMVDGLRALADRQGSVRDWAKYDGTTDTTSVYNHVEFDSFWKITSQTNANHEVTAGYTGRSTDPVIKQQKHGRRWYEPRAVRILLEQEAKIDAPQVDGMTALHRAVYHDGLKMARRLAAPMSTRLHDTTRLRCRSPAGTATRGSSNYYGMLAPIHTRRLPVEKQP